MSVFELALLDEADCWDRVNRTLEQYPILRSVYDEVFLRGLLPKRRNLDDYLLLLLTSPDEEFAQAFWSSVVRDLDTLADEGALEHFADKMRLRERPQVESMRTELALPAWVKRMGVNVTLEPPLPGTRRNPDFMAATEPTTWWEIKTISDLDFLNRKERVYRDVQSRLRRIDEPYVLRLHPSTVTQENVARAVREIKRHIATFHKNGGTPPIALEALGLRIEVSRFTNKLPFGYLGTISSGLHVFGTENMERVLKRVCSAVPQLPPGGAGIVVIDQTVSHWTDPEDVVDACFGEHKLVYIPGADDILNARDGDRVFVPGSNTRISAVASYTRGPFGEFGIQFIHNPFAATPLPANMFRFEGVTELRSVDEGGGMFRLERA